MTADAGMTALDCYWGTRRYHRAWRPKQILNGALRGFATVTYIGRDGRQWHGVVDPETLGLIGGGPSWSDALGAARATVARAAWCADLLDMYRFVARPAASSAAPSKRKSIPKRRVDVFEKSGGKCHYCGVVLILDGKWHIEHMQPRALLGSNERSNLVASCVSCNHKKRDMTAEEFIAKRTAAQ